MPHKRLPIGCSNPRNANKTQAERLVTRGEFGRSASQVVHFWYKSSHLGPFTSIKPLFFPAGIVHLAHMAPYRLTFVCQTPLWTATIDPSYEHKTIVFPAGISRLAHMAPYGPTFAVKFSSYDTPYSHIFHWKRRLGIHERHQIMHFYAHMQPSILTSRVWSIHSSISLMFLVLVKLM